MNVKIAFKKIFFLKVTFYFFFKVAPTARDRSKEELEDELTLLKMRYELLQSANERQQADAREHDREVKIYQKIN